MVNKDWMTPYNTGKVQIGCLYTPKFQPHEMTVDGLRLQRALLMKPKAENRVELIARVVVQLANKLRRGG